MSISPLNTSPQNTSVQNKRSPALDRLWFTRCPVPTATGLAYKLGWLDEEFARDGIAVGTLQETRELARHHYDHDLPALIREGGNMLALAARAQGASTRLIGLTWIDEWQTILVRANSGISEPHHLKGLRLALPEYIEHPIASHVRGSSIARGMSLQGYHGALAYAGLGFDDIELVQVPSGAGARNAAAGGSNNGLQSLWAGLDYLAAGKVDAVYVKGASAVDAAQRIGAVVGIDLDRLGARKFRVNNGTPRPLTVHTDLLENHFDVVVRFLYQTLRAADWAAANVNDVLGILQSETSSSAAGAAAAYRDDFHKTLHPDLSDERLQLFEQQKKFLWLHGLLDRDFDFAPWLDRRPLAAAYELLEADRRKAGR
ncbi:MAG TPA: ABC transporter substrate-binding protein [Spongiibacteraceae bacterium]|nr:ABC transporter substrate-binding protein [Spongiibacteraceae bacterium]